MTKPQRLNYVHAHGSYLHPKPGLFYASLIVRIGGLLSIIGIIVDTDGSVTVCKICLDVLSQNGSTMHLASEGKGWTR